MFAFGCVLYEMLTGRRAFDGKSSASIMAAILEREPASLVTHDSQIPPLVASLVEKCLAKSPEDRWQSAADLGTALRWIAAAPPGKHPGAEATTFLTDRGGNRPPSSPGCLVALAVGAMLAGATRRSTALPASESRFEVTPPPGTNWAPSPVASTAQLALSPDGRQLAFIAAPAREPPRIWIRPLDSLQARPLEGTDDAAFPFWSPDGRSIAFFSGGKLKKISTAGGTPQVLADAPLGRGGSWSRDDVILFNPSPNLGLWRVPAAGGPLSQESRIHPERSGDTHVYPQFLPDGRRFIYYARSDIPELQGIWVRDLGSEEPTQVMRNNGMAVHTPGYLLLVRDGTLFAQPVDDATMQSAG